MITILFDNTVREFVSKRYNHPCVLVFKQVYNMAQFDPCHETVNLLLLAAKELMDAAKGDMQIMIGSHEQEPEPRFVGHA